MNAPDNIDYGGLAPREARLLFRNGLVRQTSGMCHGYLQVSMKIIPKEHAFDFLLFCQRNPAPQPVVEVLEAGVFSPRVIATDADVRTDCPRYRLWEHGKVTATVNDILRYWRDDLVTFFLGGSFTFERTLERAGIPMRHNEENVPIPIYVTNVMTNPAGPFRGPIAVTMRPIRRGMLARAVEVTSRIPKAHGSPMWIGDPQAIGIADIDRPDFGRRVTIGPDEIPVFWACGVTASMAIRTASLDFALTQEPNHVFISDVREEDAGFLNLPAIA
ncbi:MAG: putative hydro-lyase [Burkholderiales bacterium]|nr:putative hydro-lyase [Burkholderiales bacterium]